MASYPQLASLATYALYNVVFISEQGVSEFGLKKI